MRPLLRSLGLRRVPRRLASYLNFFNVDNTQIVRFLNENKLEVKERPNRNLVVRACPLCPKPHRDDRTNLWTLNFKADHGAFLCFRCGASGSWPEFVKSLTLGVLPNNEEADNSFPTEKILKFQEEKVAELNKALAALVGQPELEGLSQKDMQNIQAVLRLTDVHTGRALTPETLAAFHVGIGHEMFKTAQGEYLSVPVVSFPFFTTSSQKSKKTSHVCKVKMRGIDKNTKQYMRVFPSGSQFGLFGYNLISDKDSVEAVVITEGEFDAMAVFQATGIPAVSLPNGASNLPPEMAYALRKVKQIYLWMDFDEVGQLNVSAYAEKLGAQRTHIIKEMTVEQIDAILRTLEGPSPGPEELAFREEKLRALSENRIKDANDALRVHPEVVRQFVNRSKSLPQLHIIRFNQLREQVKERIFNEDRFRGVPSFYFPWFNAMLKGFRRGE